MSEPFDKDAWCLRAIRQRVYRAQEDGTIWKWKRTDRDRKTGIVRRVYQPVVPQTHNRTGRVYFTMTFEGITKSVLVNRMVALALIPNPDGLPEVNHKDGVKAHNWKTNLEWSNRSEQEKHAFRTGLKTGRGTSNSNAKLTPDAVRVIRQAPAASLADLAMMYSVTKKTINDIRSGKTWTHV